MNIQEAQKRALKTAKKRGKFNSGMDRVWLDMHSEVTEASQAKSLAGYIQYEEMKKNMSEKDAFELSIKNSIDEELGDIVIGAFSAAEHYHIDLEKIIGIKMKYNEIR